MVALLAASASLHADEKVSAPNAAALFEMASIAQEGATYYQDFEDESTVTPIQLWYRAPSGNQGRLISQGIDKSVGYGGSRASYRVEVLFESERSQEHGAIYVRFPVSIPIWSDMTLQWRIKTESEPRISLGGRHGLATGWAGGTDGNTASGYGRKVEGPDEDGWELWQASVVSSKVNPAEYISSVTLYIEVAGPTRGVIHIDDITITGRLPSGWENEWKKVWEYYTVHAEKDQRADARKRLTDLRSWSRELTKRQARLRRPSGASSMLMAQYKAAAEKVKAALEAAKPLVEAVETGLKSSDRFTANVHAAELALMDARFWLDAAEFCAPYVKEQRDASVITYALDPTRSYGVLPLGPNAQAYSGWNEVAGYYENPAILPDVKPVPAQPGARLANFGARGTYVPFSFAVEAGKKLENLTFAIGELSAGGTPLGATTDLRVVAPVYMNVGQPGKEPKLRNVMLVHDPDFVRAVGKAHGYNRFKDDRTPDDAAAMQPITIEAGRTRQFYLLVKLPADASPGVYSGVVSAKAADGTELAFDLELEVLPFDLAPTPFAYSAFCDSFLADPETVRRQGFGGRSQLKTFEQLEQDFIFQAEHGFNTLHLRNGHVRKSTGGTDYTPLKEGESWDFTDFDRMLEAAVKAGLTHSPFVWISGPYTRTGPPERKDMPQTREEMVACINAFVPAVMAHCKEKGYPTPAFFGADEATGEYLKSMKPGYEAVRKAGGLVTIACYSDFLGILGPDLVLPILGGGVTGAETEQTVRATQAKGMPVWIYNCPATNVYGAPSSMRRRYGLAMWRNGENGECTWAYDDMNCGYADFATASYPIYSLAFPTWSGPPVDTPTYEALREGIYDTRYMATLERALAQAKQANADAELIAEVEKWLADVSVNEDLQKVRRQMAHYIVQLQQD